MKPSERANSDGLPKGLPRDPDALALRKLEAPEVALRGVYGLSHVITATVLWASGA